VFVRVRVNNCHTASSYCRMCLSGVDPYLQLRSLQSKSLQGTHFLRTCLPFSFFRRPATTGPATSDPKSIGRTFTLVRGMYSFCRYQTPHRPPRHATPRPPKLNVTSECLLYVLTTLLLLSMINLLTYLQVSTGPHFLHPSTVLCRHLQGIFITKIRKRKKTPYGEYSCMHTTCT
jgi:hypothetical protein